MAVKSISAAELKYAQCIAAVDLVCRDEELRKTRLRNVLLTHERDDAEAKHFDEADRADLAQQQAEYWEDIALDYQQKLERNEAFSAAKSRELDLLKAELSSLQTVSSDSANLLTEKLAMSRELANLRPELEDLRSQVATNENLFVEKLSLKRQLANCQAELDDASRDLQKLETKDGKATETSASHKKEINNLEKELAKERRERQKAEKSIENASKDELDGLRQELAKEKREREAAERAAASNPNNGDASEISTLKRDLATERLERQKAERHLVKSEAEWDAQKAILDDKLDQFRTKLRSTKESLKQAQAELDKTQTLTLAVPTAEDTSSIVTTTAAKRNAKIPRKRTAQQMEPDVAIGTPGDAAQNKRARRTTTSLVGEKSNFSITPFLNRRNSVAPDSPRDVESQEANEPLQSVEAIDSPSAQRSSAAKTKAKKIPLAPASPSKANLKVANGTAQSKPAPRTTLEKVAEEDEGDDADTAEPTDTTRTLPTAPAANNKPIKTARLSLKPKALHSFATFREGSLPPQQMQKKKRKLLGGAAKTLFDEDEEEGDLGGEQADDAGTSRSILNGQRAFGALGGTGKLMGKKGLGLLGGIKKKGPLVVANDGFMFSPLKKDRKNMMAVS